jgi:hypothetical protein
MTTIYNGNIVKKTVFVNITVPGAAAATSSVSTGIIIPKGAIVTGVRWNSGDAVTLTAASATAVIRAGATNLFTPLAISAWGAQTVPVSSALTNAAGIALTIDSEVNLLIQASSNSSCVASYDVYVDYLYCAGRE